MNRYEIGFIITPEASEEECKKITDSVVAVVKKSGGQVESLNEWGLKKLAFPIHKHTDGYYVFLVLEMPGAAVTPIERRMRQVEKIIRFIIFRLDDKLEKANKLVKKWKKMEHLSRKAKEAVKEEPSIEDADANGGSEEEVHAVQ